MLAQAPDQALGLWDKLWQDGTELTYLCERIGLARLASQQAAIPVPDWPIQRALYAGFVFALAQGGQDHLLQLATDKVFDLALARLYPASSEAQQRTTIATSRQRAQLHLQKALAQPIKLRERFSVEKDIAHMVLRVATTKGEWQDLLQCTGTRLKPLKLQAYQSVLDMPASALRAKFLAPNF